MKTLLPLLLFVGVYLGVEGAKYVDFDKLAEEYLKKKYPEMVSMDMKNLKFTVEDNLEFMNPVKKISEKPIKTIVKTFVNKDAKKKVKQVFNETYKYDEVYTWTVTKGIKVKKSPEKKNKQLIGFILKTILSDKEGTTASEKQAKTMKKAAKIKVPPNSEVTATWVIIERVVEIPWKIKLNFQGNVIVNLGGPKKKTEKIDLKKLVLDGFDNKEATFSKGLKNRAEGTIIVKTAYSKKLEIKTKPLGGARGRAAEDGEVEEEQASADDIEEKSKSGVVPFFRALIDNVKEDLAPESKLGPWLVIAGSLFEFLAGETQSDEQWKEFGKALKDVAVQIFNSEWGKAQWEKFKGSVGRFFKRLG